jgi:hypothetical protein
MLRTELVRLIGLSHLLQPPLTWLLASPRGLDLRGAVSARTPLAAGVLHNMAIASVALPTTLGLLLAAYPAFGVGGSIDKLFGWGGCGRRTEPRAACTACCWLSSRRRDQASRCSCYCADRRRAKPTSTKPKTLAADSTPAGIANWRSNAVPSGVVSRRDCTATK